MKGKHLKNQKQKQLDERKPTIPGTEEQRKPAIPFHHIAQERMKDLCEGEADRVHVRQGEHFRVMAIDLIVMLYFDDVLASTYSVGHVALYIFGHVALHITMI